MMQQFFALRPSEVDDLQNSFLTTEMITVESVRGRKNVLLSTLTKRKYYA